MFESRTIHASGGVVELGTLLHPRHGGLKIDGGFHWMGLDDLNYTIYSIYIIYTMYSGKSEPLEKIVALHPAQCTAIAFTSFTKLSACLAVKRVLKKRHIQAPAMEQSTNTTSLMEIEKKVGSSL